MPRNLGPSDELLRTAAELRAGGASWAVVGKAVGRSAGTVRHWPWIFAVRWAEVLAQASTDLLNEAAAESLLVLRRQLRSKSELASRDAAGKIIRFHTATRAKDSSLPPPLETDRPVRPSVRALSEYLEGLTDAELADLSLQDRGARLAALVAAADGRNGTGGDVSTGGRRPPDAA
jgi:hypothetical protein